MELLRYWADRNGSTRYSEKLDGMIRASLRVLASHPKVGRPTSDVDVRVKAVGEHLLFYSFSETELHVLTVWHAKRDPKQRPFSKPKTLKRR